MSSTDALPDAPKAVEFLSESELSNLRAEWDDKDRRNLYISVAYHGKRGKVLYFVHRINLKALLFDSDFEITTTEFSKDGMGACAGFGTGLDTIFLAGGFRAKFSEELVVPEPSTEILALSVAHLRKVGWVPFLHGKVWPLIWEVGGRLYVLASNPPPTQFKDCESYEWKNCFEMYDGDQNRWVSLPDPPSFSDPFGAVDESADAVDESTDAIDESDGVWDPDNSVKRFSYYSSFSYARLGDWLFVSNPYHPGKLSHKCELSGGPVKWNPSSFQFEGVTLGIETAGGFLVFSYVSSYPPAVIKVHLLMNGNDEPVLCQSLMIPELKYPNEAFDEIIDSQFVDIGGEKVCFLCSTRKKSQLPVIAITFSFKLEEINGRFDLQAKFFHTCTWDFAKNGARNAFVSALPQMVGAIVA